MLQITKDIHVTNMCVYVFRPASICVHLHLSRCYKHGLTSARPGIQQVKHMHMQSVIFSCKHGNNLKI